MEALRKKEIEKEEGKKHAHPFHLVLVLGRQHSLEDELLAGAHLDLDDDTQPEHGGVSSDQQLERRPGAYGAPEEEVVQLDVGQLLGQLLEDGEDGGDLGGAVVHGVRLCGCGR